jgi:hypothetical protein
MAPKNGNIYSACASARSSHALERSDEMRTDRPLHETLGFPDQNRVTQGQGIYPDDFALPPQ